MVQTGLPATVHDDRGPGAFAQLRIVEREAVDIFCAHANFLPVVLQIPAYAAEMISRIRGLKVGSPEVAELVKDRMERTAFLVERLNGSNPPRVRAVVDEAVLRRVVGGADVMREQLEHLLRMTSVELALIPFAHGAHPVLAGPVEIHRMADGETWQYFEGVHNDEFVRVEPDRVDQVWATVDATMKSGVDGRATAESLIRTL